MAILVLSAKAAVAVLLLVAGGAKLADLPGFAAAIRLFLPDSGPAWVLARAGRAGAALAAAELLAGAASLCWPAARWVNGAVLALACGFCVVAIIGYARHRDRPCRCFGALTRRSFSLRTILQAAAITAAAVLAAGPARPAQLDLGPADQLLLIAVAGLLVLAAFTAARALATGDARPEMAA
jgi:hypothetical protein